MFSEISGALSSSHQSFEESIKDSFGNSIINDVYVPLENELNNIMLAWEEAEIKKAEIQALLMELRMIL